MINKPGKDEKRPLGIPTIATRVQQTLIKIVLEPQWEAKFGVNSYWFRLGRPCHDAIKAIYGAPFRKQKHVLDTYIAGCFDNINHQQLLKKVDACPRIIRIIKSWLKAGIVNKEFPPKSNIAVRRKVNEFHPCLPILHGMEDDARNTSW